MNRSGWWIAVSAGLLLAWPVGLRAQDLASVLPGIKEAPAPEWTAEGQRLAYYSIVASSPASPSYYTPNEDGQWESGDGKRWDQWTVPGAAGHGFTLVDVLALGREGALLSIQAWQKDLLSGKTCPIAGGRSFQTCLPGGGDWWIHPNVLAKVPEVLHVDPGTLEQIKVLRMKQKMIDGKVRNVLRFQFEYLKARHIMAYELETGLLVYKATAAQGGGERFSKGNTLIMQMWLMDRRQLQTPWSGQPLHDGLVKGKTLRYEGTLTVQVPAARSELTLPLASDVSFTGAGRTWCTFEQTTALGALQGLPAPAPEVKSLAAGTGQPDALWIPPAILKTLKAGQVIDKDPTVNQTISVKSVGRVTVVLADDSEAVAGERTYDATSGLMIGAKVAGGPGEMAKSEMQMRLTRGALGAPKVGVEERPARPDVRPPAHADKCPKCGAAVKPDDKFCAQCGAKLTAAGAAGTEEAAPAGRTTADPLVGKLTLDNLPAISKKDPKTMTDEELAVEVKVLTQVGALLMFVEDGAARQKPYADRFAVVKAEQIRRQK